MIIRLTLALLVSAAVANSASAKVVYLDCERENGGGRLREAFSLNEGDGSGTVSIPKTGYSSGRLPANFGPNDVVLSKEGDLLTDTYIISRTNLKYSLVRTIGSNEPRTHDGVCKVGQAPKRKF